MLHAVQLLCNIRRLAGRTRAPSLHLPSRLFTDTGSWPIGSNSDLELVAVTLLLALALGSLDTNLLVVLLEGSQVLARFREFALLHSFADVMVDERTLGVHKIELVVDAGHDFRNGRAVRDHADRAHDLGEVTAGHHRRRLVVDAALEAGRAPVDELDRALRLDGRHGGVHILGHDIPTVHHAARHVLAMTRVALNHHRRRLEHGVRDLGNAELLVVRLLRRDDRRVRREHEVDARVRHQVRLELGDAHVEGPVEAERRREGRDHLRQKTVEVGVGRPLDVEVAAADVVEGLVVDLVGHVRVLEERVHAQHGVVRLNARRGDLRAGPHGERDLRLLAVVDREALEEQAAETRACAATAGVEDHETLKTRAVVRELAKPVEDEVNDLLADRVVATGEVVRGILLTGDQLLRVEQLPVRTSADLIDDRRLQVDEDAARDVLAGTSLGEERVEGIITATDRLVARHLAVRLNTVLQTEELPATVPDLAASLAHVDEDPH